MAAVLDAVFALLVEVRTTAGGIKGLEELHASLSANADVHTPPDPQTWGLRPEDIEATRGVLLMAGGPVR